VLKLLRVEEDDGGFRWNRNSDDVVLREEKAMLRDFRTIRSDRRISTTAVSFVFLRSDD
jgi:hypothetical protein